MAENINLVVYPAKDMKASKAFFTTFLGTEPYADTEYYVGYRVGDLEIGLAHQEDIIAYKNVEDIQASLNVLLDAGASTVQEPKDVAGGLLIAQIKDSNGNVLGLRQAPKK